MAKKTLKEKKEEKIAKIMSEYGKGKLHSGGDGKVVKNRQQAVAIAISESEKIGKKKKK